MALLARIKSPDWQDGDILTAADLKAEFNNIVNGLNGTADIAVVNITASGDITCDDITCDDIVADDVTCDALTANVSVISTLDAGRIFNLGLSLSSGTLSVVDAGGSALGSSNYGYVVVPSTTAGRQVALKVNTPASFANTATTNFECGVSAGVNWAQDVPWFIYVANRSNNNLSGADGDSVFFISRSPCMKTTPSSANNIGDTGAIPATDDQTSILILDDVTVANYVSLPCQLVGAIRMQYATATHIWSVQTLGNNDGFGKAQLEKTLSTLWTMPTGQNGAASGKHWLDNGGTAPVFSTTEAYYMIDSVGQVDFWHAANGDGGTDGAGAVTATVAAPYVGLLTTAIDPCVGAMEFTSASVTVDTGIVKVDSSGGTPTLQFIAATSGSVNNDDFGNGARTFRCNARYKVYV